MKLFSKSKDGGPESTVTGYWLVECKSLFSVVLLKFEGKSREAYHSHAFNSLSWVLKGWLRERHWDGLVHDHVRSIMPIITLTDTVHKVDSLEPVTWVLSFRGPWQETWQEWTYEKGFTTLSNGRKEVSA
jgi:hypothetical protein